MKKKLPFNLKQILELKTESKGKNNEINVLEEIEESLINEELYLEKDILT